MEQKLTTKEEYLKRINVIVEYINNHLDENIDLGMLAEMSGFSPWHFHRIVRAFLVVSETLPFVIPANHSKSTTCKILHHETKF